MFKKILKIKFNIILIIIATLIVVQLISAYIFGFIVQKQKDKQIDYFLGNSSIFKIVKRDYHRGFFSSDITVEVALNSETIANVLKVLSNNGDKANSPATHSYSIKYNTHIEHGLFAGVFHGNFLPMLSYSNTEVIYSDSVKAALNKFFNGKTPLEITDITYLNKSGKIIFYSPGFDYEEAVSGVKVIWGGVTGIVGYNGDFTKFSNLFSMPDLQLLAPTKGEMTLRKVEYASNTHYSPNKIKVGTTNLKVGLAKIEWKDKITLNFKLGDVLRMITGINSVEFLNGIDAIDPTSFTFSQISYVSDSEDKNNFFNADARIQFASLVTSGKTYGPLDLDLAIKHILAPQFSKLSDEIDKFSASSTTSKLDDDAKKDAFIKLLKDNFGPILVESPVVDLSRFSLDTPNGSIKISGRVTTNGFILADMNNQDKFLDKLFVDVAFSMPKPIVSYMFMLQMKYLLSAGNAELDKQSSEALSKVVNILLDNQIAVWTKKGYIKNNDGLLESHLVMQNGKLVINDKPTK